MNDPYANAPQSYYVENDFDSYYDQEDYESHQVQELNEFSQNYQNSESGTQYMSQNEQQYLKELEEDSQTNSQTSEVVDENDLISKLNNLHFFSQDENSEVLKINRGKV